MTDSGKLDCRNCNEREREKRNCRNRQRLEHEILEGPEEWKLYPADRRHVEKIHRTKFFTCPVSAITGKTWQIIQLVNDTTDADGNILHLPFPGSYLEQPTFYREAVRMTKTERARHRKQESEKSK